ncbi:hypothetical protein M3J09_007099 [Ascochyta lentis]
MTITVDSVWLWFIVLLLLVYSRCEFKVDAEEPDLSAGAGDRTGGGL